MDILIDFLKSGIIGNFSWGNMIMIAVGAIFIYLAVAKDFEPLLLVPIGFGILIGNIPFSQGMQLGIYEEGSVLHILYQGVTQGYYPPLIFRLIASVFPPQFLHMNILSPDRQT